MRSTIFLLIAAATCGVFASSSIPANRQSLNPQSSISNQPSAISDPS